MYKNRIIAACLYMTLPIFSVDAFAQLNIQNGQLFIQPGATVSVQGDLSSNASITGGGKLLLNGSTQQNINMNGFSITNLEISNNTNVNLVSDVVIETSLLFSGGKIIAGDFDLTFSDQASATGMGIDKFIELNGTGQVFKELTANVSSFEIPIGINNVYRPALLTSNGTYSNAVAGFKVADMADPALPPRINDYLKTYWTVSRTGITGTVNVSGQYTDPSDVTGNEANLRGYFFNGTDWTSVDGTNDAVLNRVGVPVTGNGGDVYAMNKFLLVGARAFLQGAYDYTVANTGLMADNLRTLPFGSSASTSNFPSTDPYRVAPYNTAFTHVNNISTETIENSSVVGVQSNTANNIVDWVFLELRDLTASPGNAVLQTRSALIQRDGDIVDIDGVSPVTFNYLPDGNYILAIRHRNHLGLSIDQTNPRNINENKSTSFTSNVIDFRTASEPQLFGSASAFTTVNHPSLGVVNLLWGGNANINSQTRFTGLNNDRDHLLVNSLGNVPSNFINNVYHSADVNMNKAVRFSGLNNDRDFILITVLGNIPSTFRTQALPL